MKPVVVVGAGFSGLTLAHALRQLDIPVRVVERSERAGGLIATHVTEFGLVETAANALLADEQIEKLFADLQIEFATQLPTRKKRYIFWQKARRWPVSLWTTLKLIKIPLYNFLTIDSIRPKRQETVSQWARRVINAQFEERLLAPALQGVYAGDVRRMSATMALGSLFTKHRQGKRRGSVAPRQGMAELMQSLKRSLEQSGVEFEYGKPFVLPEKLEQPTVLCTSAWAAQEIVAASDPELSAALGRCESLPLVTVTAFFKPDPKDVKGFGCLFPKPQGFNSLGVLFNDSIFAGRSAFRSETWILGGALNSTVCDLSDEQIQKKILSDRAKISQATSLPQAWNITRWPRALPHYTIEWEETLRQLKVNRPLFLHGNYLGQLGLARIQHRSKALAAQLKDLYVS